MTNKKRMSQTIFFILVLGGCLFTLYPLAWMISSSFKPELLIFQDRSLIIREFTLENYIRGFAGIGGVPYWRFMVNTFTVVIPVVIGTILSSAMTGYAFVRLNFIGRRFYFIIMLAMLMIPMHALLIPRFILFNELGWINTFLPLIVPAFFGTGSFFVFLFVQFIRGIPKEIDQSATVDGCNPVQVFLLIVLPLSKPAIVTAGIFAFIWTYDDFFSQLLYISSPRLFTIALGLRQYFDALERSAFGVLFAMSAVSLIPLLVVFILCQKYLVAGIATSGIKG